MYEEKSHVGMFRCYYCLKEVGLLLDTRLKDSLPRDCGIVGTEPCSECEEYMKQGIIIISVRDSEVEEGGELPLANAEKRIPNPYRTGGFAVVKDDVFSDLLNSENLVESIIHHRFVFLPNRAWKMMQGAGLPLPDLNQE